MDLSKFSAEILQVNGAVLDAFVNSTDRSENAMLQTAQNGWLRYQIAAVAKLQDLKRSLRALQTTTASATLERDELFFTQGYCED